MNAPANMQSRVQDYLAERRRLGFGLKSSGRALASFARYVDALDQAGPLTVEAMAEWARQAKRGRGEPETWARRFQLLRPFARYLRQFEPETEVPDKSVFGPVPGWRTPHIYRDGEIADLLAAARGLGPAGDLRAVTYETLFGLIAATGLRLSEAIHLLNADVDWTLGILTVRQTKFNKSRHLPLHPSTVAALQNYRQLRNRHVVEASEAPFFVGTRGKRQGKMLGTRQAERVFGVLRRQLGWANRGAHDAPRIHDLRHTFVVRRVLLWREQGVDVDQAMLALSTYMGHAKISHTYWYLTAVPELMALAGAKFERFAGPQEAEHVQ